MSRTIFTIRDDSSRRDVADRCLTACVGMRIEFKQPRRSPEQNDLMWARLHDIAEQTDWHGQKLTEQDWKDIFTAGLRRARVVPNLDGDGFVQLGLHTSDLTKDEMGNLLDLMDAFAAERGITFHEPDSTSPDLSHQADAPGVNTPPPSVTPGVTSSNSSDANLPGSRTDAPAAGSPRHAPSAAGAHNFEEASLLSDDWRHTYFSALIRPGDRKESLIVRHELALQMLGGKPTERELAWMRLAWRLVRSRNEGQVTPQDFETERNWLLSAPLPELETAA